MLEEAAAIEAWCEAAGLPRLADGGLEIRTNAPVIPSPLPCDDAAAAAMAAVGSGVAALVGSVRGGARPAVQVDHGGAAASLAGFAWQRLGPEAVVREPTPLTGLFPTSDGRWVQLHGGFPHLAVGLCELLDLDTETQVTTADVAEAVRQWRARELERRAAARGLCCVMVRTREQWHRHPQGKALRRHAATSTLVGRQMPSDGWIATAVDLERPLAGLRVLDMTRVLAGPACSRTLGLFGAEILHVTAPHLPTIDSFDMDTGPGKRNAYVDARTFAGQRRLQELALGADVVVSGYRPGSLRRRGLSPCLPTRQRGIVWVEISCYGPAGPWSSLRGWEQTAEAVSGIAAVQGSPDRPANLPAAVLDYLTGYLAAAAVIHALIGQRGDRRARRIDASLCGTAEWLFAVGDLPAIDTVRGGAGPSTEVIDTTWGMLTRLIPPLGVEGIDCSYAGPPWPLGSSVPAWIGSDQ